MINLRTCHRTTLNGGRVEWQEYLIVFENVRGNLAEKYVIGREEKLGSVYEIAQRIVQLKREDSDSFVNYVTGFVYDKDQNRFNMGAYVPLEGGKLQLNRSLHDGELHQLANDVLNALKGN